MTPHILHLVGTLAQGGSEHQAVQLAGAMKARGHFDVALAALNEEGPLRARAESLGFRDISAYPFNSFYEWNMMMQVRRCAADLRRRRVDLIHTHDFYANVFGMAAATLAGVPVRVASRRETGGVRTSMQRRVERWMYRLADAIVTNAKAVQDDVCGEGVARKKTCVVYNGLDTARISTAAPQSRSEILASLGLPQTPARFVTIVANLRMPVKDHPTFLRAAVKVRAAVPDARFLIAGEGELVEPMRALAQQLGIDDAAFFLGRCERVSELLSISDVCTLTSRFEGFSNAILEYMAAAKPVVATNVGGAREAIDEGRTGYLVAPGDDATIAERVIRLLQNPAQAISMGVRGREIVLERFSANAQLRQTEELYHRLLGARVRVNASTRATTAPAEE